MPDNAQTPASTHPHLPEMEALEAAMALGAAYLDIKVVDQIHTEVAASTTFPLYRIGLGNPSPNIPSTPVACGWGHAPTPAEWT